MPLHDKLMARLGADHVTPALHNLQWFPVQHHITYKLCLLMHLVHTGRVQSNLVIDTNFHNGPPLRAQKGPTLGLHWLDHVHDF